MSYMRMSDRIFPVITLLIIMSPVLLFAQHDLTLYNMGQVPQRIYLNPAFIPEQQAYVGLPFLSGIHGSIAYPFTYNNVLTRGADDSLNFEAQNFLDKVSKSSHVLFLTGFDILSVGSKIAKGRFYINFGIRERINENLYLPENLFYLLWYGNTASQIWGKSVNIAPSMNATVYDEWSFTFAGHAVKNKLTYGATVKYLSGRMNVTTKKSEFDFYTNPNTYDLQMKSDLDVQTSGINDISSYMDQGTSSLIFPANSGFAMDLGVNYQINDHFSVNASVLDLGFINWHSRTLEFVSHEPGKEFTYNGMSLHDFAGLFTDFSKYGTKILDSLKKLVHIDSVYGNNYRSNLPAQFNIGGTWSPNEKNHINLLLNGISWDHHFYPALSVSYFYNWTRHVGLTVSYNMFNRQFTNVGAGISLSTGPLQFYVVSDNVPGLIAYRTSNNTSVQFGINILVHGRQTKAPPPEAEPTLQPATEEPKTQ